MRVEDDPAIAGSSVEDAAADARPALGTITVISSGNIIAADDQAAAFLGVEGPDALAGVDIRTLYVTPQRFDDLCRVLRMRRRLRGHLMYLRPDPGRAVLVSAQVERGRGVGSDISIRFCADVTPGRSPADPGLRPSEQESPPPDDVFLYAVAHDLRSPLAALIAFAEVIAHPATPPEDVAEIAAKIAGGAAQIERMLGDILDAERAARGALRVVREDVELVALARRVIAMLDLREVEVVVRAGPVYGHVDPFLVERMLENLVRNASYHVPAGSRIDVGFEATADGVLLWVDDAGPGVPDDRKQTIFSAFDRGVTPRHAGSGVGLALVRRFAELHGGRAWVQDAPGGGASFRVSVPGRGGPPEAP